jgi:phosphatidylinositol glycan class T
MSRSCPGGYNLGCMSYASRKTDVRQVSETERGHQPGSDSLAEQYIQEQTYIPAIDRIRATTISLELSIPPGVTLRSHLPFNKAFIRYTEHPPDASRGFDLPPAILYLQDLAEPEPGQPFWQAPKPRLYSSKLLLDLATPDFSMPYNVIIMTSTLMALFFGSVFNAITRRFGVIELEDGVKED